MSNDILVTGGISYFSEDSLRGEAFCINPVCPADEPFGRNMTFYISDKLLTPRAKCSMQKKPVTFPGLQEEHVL
jgi:hypothetical protein